MADNEKIKSDILALYTRYFGSIMTQSYQEFYAKQDLPTILLSAEELFIEYAGDAKGKEIISEIKKRNNLN